MEDVLLDMLIRGLASVEETPHRFTWDDWFVPADKVEAVYLN